MIPRVDVVGVPMDLGADRRGVDMGPSAVRYARLQESLERLGITVVDRGNVAVNVPEAAPETDHSAKYLPEIEAANARLAKLVEEIVRGGGFPLVLGGDHSIAIGTLAGITRARGRPPGVLWVDAHADVNAPDTSLSGNVHGMPVHFALAAKNAIPERFAYVGLRDLDAAERNAIRSLGVRAFTMADVDRLGIAGVAEAALAVLADGPASVHLSFDMDAIDPNDAPGVGTPVRGGLTYREAHLLMEAVAAAGVLGSIEVTEINPILDRQNQTAILAVELILSALGKTVL